MKANYIQPTIEVINFATEDALLLSVSGTKVNTKDEQFEQRGNKKDMWGNDNMWNK